MSKLLQDKIDRSLEFATLQEAVDFPNLSVGMSVSLKERTVGNGGGALWDVVDAGTVTPNTFNIVAAVGNPLLALVLRIEPRKVYPIQWGAKQIGGLFNDQPAIQASVDYLVDRGEGGDVVITGDANLVGVASPDGLLNGIVVPFTLFTNDESIRIIGNELGARLRAGSNNMILLRASGTGTTAQDLEFEGAGFSGVWAMGAIPEDRTQISLQISQSRVKMYNCLTKNCDEGFVGEPGPTVAGKDSGIFYLEILSCVFNQCVRAVWFKPRDLDAEAPNNRPTRCNIAYCRLERGNVGLDLEYATETNIVGCNFQFYIAASDPSGGTGPKGNDQAAIFLGTRTEGTYIFGGASEACTFDIDNQATSFNNLVFGFTLSGVNRNVGLMGKFGANRIQVVENINGLTSDVDLTFKNDSFVKLVADPNATSTKELVLTTNGTDRMRWFNGETTHIGSSGDITFNNFGNTISSDAGACTLNSTAGFFRFIAASDGLYFRVGATDIVKVDSTRLRPITDNVTKLGDASFRWTIVYATTGTINTSDARTKTAVRSLTADESNAAKMLSKEIGVYKLLDSIKEKGDGARKHIGLTVQRAIEIMEENSLVAFEYGFICYDKWDKTEDIPTTYDEEGNIEVEGRTGREAGDAYGFRYDELNQFILKGLEQRLSDAGI